MFSFWAKDSRPCDKPIDAMQPIPLFAKPVQAYWDSSSASRVLPSPTKLKRSFSSVAASLPSSPHTSELPCTKRPKIDCETSPTAGAGATAAASVVAATGAGVAGVVGAANTGASEDDDHDDHHRRRVVVEPPAHQPSSADQAGPDTEQVKDVIQFQLSLEILHKHDELRLIDQELAKCQVALEQLRRCHLIPYPVTCPTPEQMLDVSSGKGPAVRYRPGETVPEWAAPFGVVDGPYARHYAKWLIPDPKFDGLLHEWQGPAGLQPKPCSAGLSEGRTTRNSVGDSAVIAGVASRSARALAGSKLQSLNSAYAQPKQKAPCVLKRADGKTVKLVCIDCHRENFSSTQGFINHCRIAHKRDFKSHEEAAVHCGHPIEVDEAAGSALPAGAGAGASTDPVADDRTVAAVSSSSLSSSSFSLTMQPPSLAVPAAPLAAQATGLVHTYARADVSEQQAYAALETRLGAALKSYYERKLPLPPKVTSGPVSGEPAATATPTATATASSAAAAAAAATTTTAAAAAAAKEKSPLGSFVPASGAPHLSRLLMNKNFGGDLEQYVADATTREASPDVFMADDDEEDYSEDGEHLMAPMSSPGPAKPDAASRTPGVVRLPARAPSVQSAGTRPASGSKECSPGMSFATMVATTPTVELPPQSHTLFENDMDVDLSPNTATSNNAPSLVSDDSEYDDSDDGSSSDVSDTMETESVTEIKLEDDHELTPRTMGKENTTVSLKKDQARHVTFVRPVKGDRRKKQR